MANSASPFSQQRPFSDVRKIALRGTQTKVIAVRHQAPAKDFHSPAIVDFTNRIKKDLAILFIEKDFLPRPSAIHHVIDSSGILNAKWPRHDYAEYQKRRNRQQKI